MRLTDTDKRDIRARHAKGETMYSIAKRYKDTCTYRTIQYTCKPEMYAKMRAQNKKLLKSKQPQT